MKDTYDSKKVKLVYGLIRFYIDKALTYSSGIVCKPKKGDYVYESSTLYRINKKGRQQYWAGIGLLLKVGKNGDGWQIKTLNGKITNWNNADFYRLPNEVQEILLNKER